jgi:WD40 repeat protein
MLAIAGAQGGTVSLWDRQQEQVTAERPVDGSIKRLRFSRDSRQLRVVGYRLTDTGGSNFFYHWDLATNTYSQVTQPNLLDVGFDAQGNLLQAIAKEDGTLQILNASNQPLQQFNSGVSHAPFDAVFNLDGSRIFINQQRNDGLGLKEGAIVRDLNTGEVTALGQDFTFAFSADGKQLATTGAADGMVRLRTGAGEPIEFKAHQTQVANLDFREDGRQLATASADGTVRIWSVDPQPLASSQPLPGAFQSVAFQPGSNQIIGQSADGVLQGFNAQGEPTYRSQTALPLFSEMSFSPDGHHLVALATDGTLYSLAPDGTGLKPFEGNYSPSPAFPPSNVAFSPNGKQVAVISEVSGAEDEKQINILNVASGQVVKRIPQRRSTRFDQVIWQPGSATQVMMHCSDG